MSTDTTAGPLHEGRPAVFPDPLSRIKVSIGLMSIGTGRFVVQIIQTCECEQWTVTMTLADWSNLASVTESARIHLASSVATPVELPAPAVPAIYDRDDLDEMSYGVLAAYAEVRAQLVTVFAADRLARQLAIGVLDEMAFNLIEDNTEPDDDEDPDDEH